MRRWGVPDEVLTDNGKVFTGRLGPHPVEVLFDRICRENGIVHRLTGVRSRWWQHLGGSNPSARTLPDQRFCRVAFALRRRLTLPTAETATKLQPKHLACGRLCRQSRQEQAPVGPGTLCN